MYHTISQRIIDNKLKSQYHFANISLIGYCLTTIGCTTWYAHHKRLDNVIDKFGKCIPVGWRLLWMRIVIATLGSSIHLTRIFGWLLLLLLLLLVVIATITIGVTAATATASTAVRSTTTSGGEIESLRL
jgi:hypothetical protein